MLFVTCLGHSNLSKVTINLTPKNFLVQKAAELKYLAQNLPIWATFLKVLLNKNLKFSLSQPKQIQEPKIKPGT